MEGQIAVTKADREMLQKIFKVTERTVFKALSAEYGVNNTLHRRIRKAALERGGQIMVTLREVETIHDAGGMMKQSFPNGAKLEISKLDGTARVIFKGKEVASFENVTVAQLYDIQNLAYHLGRHNAPAMV